VRNLATWFQLGVMGDAGPEITNGLGASTAVSRLLHDLDGPHVATKPLWAIYESLV
jgi:hypothetical protein